jgi:DNA polymerase-4
MPRKILHLDLDAFFCAVEERARPDLRGRPFAVGGRAEARGVVASCSYPARAYGVRSAMSMWKAQQLCPGLIVVATQHGNYRQASAEVMAILHQTTPLVEQLSIDEAFLDVSELPAPAQELAQQLQARINTELGLPCSLGVASNKLLAKIANNQGKGAVKTGDYPNAITIVPPGQEAAYLAPLPVIELWGVGAKTAERLAEMGIYTIGDLAARPRAELVHRFGKLGEDFHQHAQGQDERPIVTEYETKSISRETTFDHDQSGGDFLEGVLGDLSESVARSLKKEGLRGNTVKIKLRWSDFTTLTRQTTLPQATDQAEAISAAAIRLLRQHRPPERALRLIGVGVSNLGEPAEKVNAGRQLGLWEAPPPPPAPPPPQLAAALEHLRAKFGEEVVHRGGD